MQVEPNPELELEHIFNINLSDMPDGLKCLFIIPDSYKTANEKEKSQIKPYIYTFKDTNIFLKDILVEYEKQMKIQNKKDKLRAFTLNNGTNLKMDYSLRDLQNILKKINKGLDRMIFYVYQYDPNESDQDQYIDQCCMVGYLQQNDPSFKDPSSLTLKFMVCAGKHLPQILQIEVNNEQQYEKALGKLISQIHKKYGVLFMMTDVQSSIIQQNKQKLDLKKNLKIQKVYKDDKIIVRIKKNVQLKRINSKDFNSYLLIYKEGEKQPFKAKYNQICDTKFDDLYKMHLELSESKLKKDAIYCLKIMDMIINPDETISKAQIYFTSNNQNKPIFIVGKVVNQKMIFYKAIPPLALTKQFGLDQFNIPKHQEQKRQHCRKKTEEKAYSATTQYFKNNAKNVQPIMIYTTQLKHVEPQTKKEQVIYVSLNKYLRETKILSLDETTFQKEWRLKYASTLLKHLSNIKDFKGQTWRGINFDPKIEKIGEILTFKQFTSTSKDQKTAISFAKKKTGEPYHILKFSVLRGKSIIQYSYYSEGQILLLPYSQFKVRDIILKENGKFKYYLLQQIQTPKELPKIKANFLIWIDDKLAQGQKIFEKIQTPNETVILQQIVSTQQLKIWLMKNQKLMSDPTANVIFITNMSRKQLNGFNQKAGVEGAKLIRQKNKTIPIYFYIGDIEKTQQKLKAGGLDKSNIIIGNRELQMLNYIKQKITS